MITRKLSERSSRSLAMYIHIVIWIMIFAFPLILEDRTNGIRWSVYFRHIEVPLIFFVVFYLNYGLLVPHYYMTEKYGRYFACNALVILALTLFQHGWYFPYLQSLLEVAEKVTDAARQSQENRHHPPRWAFITRDIVMLGLTAGLGATIRMSSQWQKAEDARQEAERNRMAAELNNLRNQLNPHFLLNTLNNIYALIAFDTDKAQQTVQDLSKLLRYVLYENQGTYVPLCKEVDFISNYIDLMRIRIHKDVSVKIDIQVKPESQTPIAPLLFISLIENAFKHGISPTASSFISISIREEDNEVRCEILNSNHPKNHSDKSGSGIGLEQVKKRLELIYPHKYTWEKGPHADGSVYASFLSIRTN